ncbi:MAG: ComEC family competence protein [Ruminococcaceae bacterium]|nr:ComEC family competence protein [Oscillospiraceae bacterium]
MKRPIIWFCLSLMAGIYCCAYAAKQLLFCGILFALLCFGLFILKRSFGFLFMIFFFGLGSVLLSAHQTILIDRPASLHLTEGSFEGTIIQASENNNGRYSYQVSLTSLNETHSFLKLWISTQQKLNAGDVISGTGTLSSSKMMKQEEKGFGAYLIRQGISLYCSEPKLSSLPLSKWSKVRYAPLRIRMKMIALLDKHLEYPWKGILIAISTGDRSQITSVQQTQFSKTGTSHVLSVSGLHVTILLMTLLALLEFFRVPYPASRWICLPVPVFLALFMGGQAPVLRACIMGFLFLLGECLWTESDSVNSLFLAALLLLLAQPTQLFQAGFLLSFSCTLGILAFSDMIQKGAEKIFPKSRVLNLISVTLSSYITSLMVLLSFYHQFPMISLIANLIVVPLFSVLLSAVFLFAITTALVPQLAPLEATLLDFMSELIFGPLTWLSKIPTIELAIPNRFFVAAYCFFLVFCYFLTLRRKNFMILFCFVLCLIAGSIQQYRFSRYDSLSVINAGCIQNVLIQTKEGNTLLFAGVSGNSTSYFYDYQDFLDYFKKNNIKTIDVFCFMNYNKSTVALFRDLGKDRTIGQSLLPPQQSLASEIERIAKNNQVKLTDFTQPFSISLSGDNRCHFYPNGTLLWYYQDTMTADIGKELNQKALINGKIGTGEVAIYGRTYSNQEQGTLRFLIKKGIVEQLLLETTYEQGGLP